uniref:C-type lectin domain-containing protein n=1 Tax=Poecilia reticulata TaxID=8081 RepID=A0A3P9NLW8_POERE
MDFPVNFLKGYCCFMDCQLYEFHYINENKNWTEAQQYCREKHTDLVTVTNMEGLNRLLSKSPGSMTEAWIGLYDQTHGTRTWRWSLPGVEFNENETKWNDNEPNDNDIENCRWKNENCAERKPFICYDGELNLAFIDMLMFTLQ